ncbi:hypothetical protein GINT2_001558 [Glugoides intestinalis]
MKQQANKDESMCESSTKRENFLHKTTNVTEWMEKRIVDFIERKGYEVVLIDVDASIMTRLDKISVINTIKMKMADADGKVISLDGYTSMNNEYDDIKLKWLIDFIKEAEREVLLTFGGIALGTESVKKENKPVTELEVSGKKEFGKLQFDTYFCVKMQDMLDFIVNPKWVICWTGLTTEICDEQISFENVILKNIKNTGDSIEMEYKWKDWSEFSQVSLKLTQVGSDTKVALSQKHVPVQLLDNVRNHWESRIFKAISNCFGCAIKQI